MPSLTLDNHLIWFAHCPKAGGTSIETLLVETWGDRVGHLRWGWDLWWKRGGWRAASPPNSPQHLIWADAERILPVAPDRVFALVRDPADRMMSEYRYQRRYRRGTFAGRLLAFLPFALWLELMLAVVKRNPYAFDNHLRPQSDFVPTHAKVFQMEEGLEPAVAWLGDVTRNSCLSLPPHILKTKSGQTPGPDMQALIYAAFAEDYDRFGYAVPASQPPRRRPFRAIAWLAARCIVALERRGLL